VSTLNDIIAAVKKQGRTILSEDESKKLLRELQIKTTELYMAGSKEEAVAQSSRMGFPVVLKIASPDISHKSDAGGVKINLKDGEAVAQAYEDIISSCKRQFPDAAIEGVAVQNMVKPGIEVIIGMTKDPQFGPVIMFGLGGVWMEVLKDVSFRIAPLTQSDAAKMIKEIKGYSLLQGYRGTPPADIAVLEDILMKISRYAVENPDIREIDLNPIFAYSDHAVAVDARVILEN
jgi:acyl-CoA synthetase (NDP forming)